MAPLASIPMPATHGPEAFDVSAAWSRAPYGQVLNWELLAFSNSRSLTSVRLNFRSA